MTASPRTVAALADLVRLCGIEIAEQRAAGNAEQVRIVEDRLVRAEAALAAARATGVVP